MLRSNAKHISHEMGWNSYICRVALEAQAGKNGEMRVMYLARPGSARKIQKYPGNAGVPSAVLCLYQTKAAELGSS